MLATDDLARQALSNTTFEPYWLDSLEPVESLPALNDDLRTELLVVGGGFCGLWGAILAKQQRPDVQVVLIEAKSIANGASGRPAAILSTSVMHGIDNTERTFPTDVAELEELGKLNLDAFRETIERHDISCDLEWGGELKVSVGDDGLDAIDEDHLLYQKYGHDSVKLDKVGVQSEINSPLFHGGVWSRQRCGTVHPGKLIRGLKALALALGVTIYENTPHQSNTQTDGMVVVKTPQGTISAQKVLLATNAFAAGHSRIKRRVVAVRDRIVVTEPLSREQMASVGWANRQGVYDTRTQLNYMRLTSDNRILFGGRLDYFYGNNTDPKQDKTAEPYIPATKGNIFLSCLERSYRPNHAHGGSLPALPWW